MWSFHARPFVIILLLGLTLAASGCAPKPLPPPPEVMVPGKPPPALIDDLDAVSLAAAVEHSITYLGKLPADRLLAKDPPGLTVAQLLAGLETFVAILKQSPSSEELARLVKKNFTLVEVSDRLLVTGYYEPVFSGSLTRSPPFIHPLYRRPDDLVILDGTGPNAKRIGRLKNGALLPYWSRAEIETSNRLAGSELVWLADPVDAFILHVQGSGKIRLPDGSLRNVHFAAANGRPYRSIGRLLAEEGRMPLEEITLPSIKAYLKDHPAERDRILRYNESFIFFQFEEGETPKGSLAEVLTPGRSAAADFTVLPAGALCLLTSEKPALDHTGGVAGWLPFSRFILLQDSGAAITGRGRLDLFWGSDSHAEIAAGHMKQPGRLYLLVPKEGKPPAITSLLKKDPPQTE